MPKVSVYLPDELYERARASDANVSQLIQTALRQHLGQQTLRPAFASDTPADMGDAEEQLAQRLASEARQIYERGYRCGLEVAKQLHWDDIDLLAEAGWKVSKWFATLRFKHDGTYEQSLAPVFDPEITGEPTLPTYDLGFVDALKGLWNSVREHRPSNATTAEPIQDRSMVHSSTG